MSRLLLITRPACGGAERITLLYGKILQKVGYDIDILLPNLSVKRKDTLSPFIPENWNRKIINSRMRYFIFHIFSYIKKTKPDIVFTSTIGFANILLVLKFFGFISCKIAIRECNMPSTHNVYSVLLFRLFNKSSDAIISQTKEMKEEMVSKYHIDKDRIKVINNPIDKDLILSKLNDNVELHNSNNYHYMACCRIYEQKDIVTLIKSFSIVHKKIPNSDLYIIGSEGTTQYMDIIHNLIKTLNVPVYLVGFQTNPYKYLKNASVFVLSSIYEGLPNVLLEAMYLGIPVAATRCIPYINQIVNEGTNGYTSEVGNPDNLAEAMINALSITKLPLYNDVNDSDSQVINLFKRLESI